jgi:hypothetical protein
MAMSSRPRPSPNLRLVPKLLLKRSSRVYFKKRVGAIGGLELKQVLGGTVPRVAAGDDANPPSESAVTILCQLIQIFFARCINIGSVEFTSAKHMPRADGIHRVLCENKDFCYYNKGDIGSTKSDGRKTVQGMRSIP